MAFTLSRCSCQMIWKKWHQIEGAENVFAEILSRLPVKSLLAYKSVSKFWYKLISSQVFADLQLRRSRDNPVYLIYRNMDTVMEFHLMRSDRRIINSISWPSFGNLSDLYMICSHAGIVCCISSSTSEEKLKAPDMEILICNPATREFLILPKGTPCRMDPSIGIAFGPRINDYKVFRIFLAEPTCKFKPQHYECEVYTSSNGYWSRLGTIHKHPMRHSHSPYAPNHVFVGGKVHWFVASDDDPHIPDSILSVDFEGRFTTIDLPVNDVTEHSYLIDLEGRLSLVILYDEHMVSWVLEDSHESQWKAMCNDDVCFMNSECVYSVTACKKEILFMTTYYWYVYKLSCGIWKTWEKPPTDQHCPVAFRYSESLLSCSGHRTPDLVERRSCVREEYDS